MAPARITAHTNGSSPLRRSGRTQAVVPNRTAAPTVTGRIAAFGRSPRIHSVRNNTPPVTASGLVTEKHVLPANQISRQAMQTFCRPSDGNADA